MGVAEFVSNPREYGREKREFYGTLLFDPGRFFDDYIGDRGFRSELLLVTFVGLVGMAGTLYAVLQIRSNFDIGPVQSDLPRDVSFQLWGQALSPLIGAFFLWIAFAIALYLISWLYSTEGQFFPMLKNTAWSLVPLAVANLVLTVALVLVSMGADIDTDLNQAGGTAALRSTYVWEQIVLEPMVLGARAVGILFLVWCGYLAAHGVAEVRDLDVGSAARATAIPVGAYVLWHAYQLVGVL